MKKGRERVRRPALPRQDEGLALYYFLKRYDDIPCSEAAARGTDSSTWYRDGKGPNHPRPKNWYQLFRKEMRQR